MIMKVLSLILTALLLTDSNAYSQNVNNPSMASDEIAVTSVNELQNLETITESALSFSCRTRNP